MQNFKGFNRSLKYLAAIIFIGFLWEVLAVFIDNPGIPHISQIVLSLFGYFNIIASNFWYSLYRVVFGIMLGLTLALPIGMLSFFKTFDEGFSSVFYIMYPVPHIVLLPLFLILFGIGDLSKILLIAFIVFFQIWMPVRDSARSVDKSYVYSLLSLGAKNKDILIHLVFPSVLPALFTGLRVGIGTSIAVLFFVESFATTHGLGYLIMDCWSSANYPLLYASMTAMAFMGLAFYFFVEFLQRVFCKWIFL